MATLFASANPKDWTWKEWSIIGGGLLLILIIGVAIGVTRSKSKKKKRAAAAAAAAARAPAAPRQVYGKVPTSQYASAANVVVPESPYGVVPVPAPPVRARNQPAGEYSQIKLPEQVRSQYGSVPRAQPKPQYDKVPASQYDEIPLPLVRSQYDRVPRQPQYDRVPPGVQRRRAERPASGEYAQLQQKDVKKAESQYGAIPAQRNVLPPYPGYGAVPEFRKPVQRRESDMSIASDL